MYRWSIDTAAGTTTECALDDVSTEYPRIDENRTGLHNRFVYATSFSLDAEPDQSEILRYDTADGGSVERHRFPTGHTCGEPVFVARGTGDDEDDGVLLAWAHDHRAGTSYLAIVDAANVATAPLAEIHLPRRVPNGFHGAWVPQSLLED